MSGGAQDQRDGARGGAEVLSLGLRGLVGRESPRGLFPLGVPPSAREPHLRTRISPLREAPRTCSEALWVPLEGQWNGDRLPCLAGLVFFFFNPSLRHRQSLARLWHLQAPPPRTLRGRRSGGGWRPGPTREQSLICISFSSYYRATRCESILTAAVSKVQAAAIGSDWLKTPMAVC